MTITKVTAGLISAEASAIDLNIDANTLYIDASENRVGIGTSSPSAPLHVVGHSFVQNGTLFTDAITSYSGSSLHLNAGSSNFRVTVNGSERARIDSSGNFLAGTTSSSLSSSSSATGINLNPNGASAFVRDGGTTLYINRLSSDGDITQFRKDGTSIGSIGVSSSDLVLTSSVSDKDILFKGNDGGSAITALTLDMSKAGAATFNGNLTVNGPDVTIPSNIIHAGDSDTYFGFNDANTFRIVTGGTEALRVDSSQRVGIGTTSMGAPLHITNATPVIRLTDSDTSRFAQIVATDGNLRFDADNNDEQSSTNISFRTDGTERVRIDSSGNFGIGTSSPVTKLHVMDGTAQSGISHTYVYDSTSLSIEAGEPAIQLRAEDSGTHGGSLLWRYGNNVFSAIANPTDDTIDYIYGVSNANDFKVHTGEQLSSYRKIMTLGADGNVGIGDGNLKFASGHGIDFSATANTSATGGSVDTELLDDYEEGRWTAVLSASGGGFAASTTSFSGGYYTKIGNMVTAHIYTGSFNITNAGSGYAKIGGLPYASMSNTYDYGSAIFYHSNCFAESSVTGYVAAVSDFTISTPTDQDAVTAVGWKVANTVYLMVQVQYMTPS